MSKPFLEVRNLVKRFGGLAATNNCSLEVMRGETHALIGPNGAGKTTLISQLQGQIRPDEGHIFLDGQDITETSMERRALSGMARSFQISSVFPKFTAIANAALAVQARKGDSFRFLGAAWLDRAMMDEAREAIELVGLGDRAEVLAQDLSHGERRQLELAMVLAMRPSLLLLDEPMAGMGKQDSARMTRLLADLKKNYTILLVEHDMNAVFALADRVSVLVAGRTIATGSPADIRANDDVKAAYLGHRQH
ncbi:branched-chain amino acid transport system ATP-binding protein [Pseudochelatococcus lubricantis]|uniref:Branched-chain amino acid transport system ATP-binding protein n=1 Tax=Pseudochelatococcus lubricantis TaxID=1538102 RepID=A0ABX0V0H3_9HYPH|nr:ABC transporter ATP-binding protein [Pseudochelatococcus lubricantis]NIJ56601.1 branched-chain amino acid transport system ATP-binding protein [Pseudochelatococcus lubricantis]